MISDDVIRKIGNCPATVEFATTPARLFILLSHLQLALRHPDNIGESAAIARQIADNLANMICHYVPEARQLIEMGWNPACDVTREYAETEFFGEGDR
ncbi:MAG TPA: hypothetical protein V6D10_20670 [Trichocoleus sp.]|jgi:hypothetical protein